MKLTHTTTHEIRVGLSEYLRRTLSNAAFAAKVAAEKIAHSDQDPRALIAEVRAQMDECERFVNALDEVGEL